MQDMLRDEMTEKGENKLSDWSEMIDYLDYSCCKIAEKYNLFWKKQPRKGMIIEILAKNSCTSCLDRALKTENNERIDEMYSEIHQLGCSFLIEELYSKLVNCGHKVNISAEEPLKFGKADVFIVPIYAGLALRTKEKEIVVEVKSGFSLSLPQVLRYLIDTKNRTLVLWRIKNKQIIVLKRLEITPLLMQFVRMVVSRAERLLSSTNIQCKHACNHKVWSPNSQQIQQNFSEFAESVVKSLPDIVEKILEIIDEEKKEQC
jgi:hypothetical protein